MSNDKTKVDPSMFAYRPVRLHLKDIVDNTRNMRTRIDDAKVKELAQSMKENGLQNRIVVKPLKDDKYEVKQGSRRLAAAISLKWDDIDCSLAPEEMGEKEHAVSGMVENLQRESLTPYEQAMGFRDLAVNYNMSGSDIAHKTGISVSYVNNNLRAVENIAPEILKQWSAGNPLATYDNVVKIASIKDKENQPDHEAQKAAWETLRGGALRPRPRQGGAVGGGGRKASGTGVRAIGKKLTAILDFVNSKEAPDSIGGAPKVWVRNLMKYLVGGLKTPPEGIVLPKKEGKKAGKGNGKKGKKGAKAT